MARDHARVKTSIWDDPDFIGLKSAEQHVYLALMSNKGLSRCGVVTYIPARFEHLAADLTPARFKAAVSGLCNQRFVVLDERTQELLLRSYVRHDGVSDAFRRAIGDELARLMHDEPDLLGWQGLAITSPVAHAMASVMESRKR